MRSERLAGGALGKADRGDLRDIVACGSENSTIGIQSRVEAQATLGESGPGVECIALQMIGRIVCIGNTEEENNGYVTYVITGTGGEVTGTGGAVCKRDTPSVEQ